MNWRQKPLSARKRTLRLWLHYHLSLMRLHRGFQLGNRVPSYQHRRRSINLVQIIQLIRSRHLRHLLQSIIHHSARVPQDIS